VRSKRVQKRQSLSPQTLRAIEPPPPLIPARTRLLEGFPPWLGVLGLAGVTLWISLVVEREIERSVADELRLVLSAEIEVAHAMLGSDDDPRAGTSSDGAPRSTPAERFAQVLAKLPVLSRIGRTGEAYAFDRGGVMLSPSRFEAELREHDLMSWRDGRAVVELRDPGGRVAAGHAPSSPRSKQPLTKMVQSALAGRDGIDTSGYRDYRGAEVVGAWRWLPRYELGVAVEIDADEASTLNEGLRAVLYALYAAMALAALAVGGSGRLYARARHQIAHAKQLGQYTLVRELGRGGMGTVYEARHTLLRRPTAVKLMTVPAGDPLITAEALLRFEREVQLTSQLSHPNTVVIYDYGRTDDGIFYYAMEYIDGVDLDHLVRVDGPLPAARVIHLALQICASLAEAHDKSLIHRDVKPANILVCERGGMPDSIKVLDFGLVKSLLGPQVSAAHVLVGTPQFMAPEVLRDPSTADPKSDIYAVGAVLYWLVTGHTIFEAKNPLAALQANTRLTPPSQLRSDLPVDLERIIMRCLARDPLERPLSMAELASELRSCRAHGSWSTQDARRYWRERGSMLVRDRPAPPDVPTVAAI
jgi:eukaryotic-like serine/threonine-protein kinase